MKSSLILFKKLNIFSDGSLLLEFKINNVKRKHIKNFNKDLKSFQKMFKTSALKSVSTFNSTNTTETFRKKLFK